jgi:fructosamine-3-kinase
LLGGELKVVHAVAGGDLSAVFAIELVDGRRAIVKGGPAPGIEAGMLAAIREAGAPAPAVLAADAAVLVIERLPCRGRPADAWSALGEALARLHRATGTRYGWYASYAFGAVAIENAWCDDWPQFWAERRLLNQLPALPGDLARRVERLASDLPNRLPARPACSLLHGDLWGGNVLVDGGRISGLIDPASYYGDREVDLAMLGLFDRPAREFYAACGELAPGRENRRPVYQLWPAIVHLRLFGSGYRPLVERLLLAAGV